MPESNKKANMAYWDEIDDLSEEYVRSLCKYAVTNIDVDDVALEIGKSVTEHVLEKLKELLDVNTDEAFPYVNENY